MIAAASTPQPLNGMEPTPATVAAAVMAVLREMAIGKIPAAGAFGTPGSNGQIARPASIPQSATKIPLNDDTLYPFTGSLILERHALSIPPTARQVLTTPGTVVTPLAREILKKRGITVRPLSPSQWAGRGQHPNGEWGLLRLCASAQAQALESMLIGRGGDGWESLSPVPQESIDWLEAAPHRHLAVLAETACTAVWWSNRAGVRAAEVRSHADVERIARTFGPRCLVVEPARLPIHEGRQIFRTWRGLGVQMAPEFASEAEARS